jgi:DMSO/TMAO reductase YedYZ molybdopterin-dependent catalytic subunit
VELLGAESRWSETSWIERIAAIFASGVSAIGTSFAIYGTSQDFFIISMSRLVLDVLPGSYVASIIWNFGDYSLAVSLVVFGVLLALVTGTVSFLGFLLGERVAGTRPVIAGFCGAVFLMGGVATLLTGLIVQAIAPTIAGGAAMAFVLERPALGTASSEPGRRPLLKSVAVVGGYNVVTHVAGLLKGRGSQVPTLDSGGSDGQGDTVQAALDSAASKSLNVDGLPGYVVDTESFYKVDINPRPPVVSPDQWRLTVTGAVGEERTFDYESIKQRETVTEQKTLRCLGDPIDGEKIGTAVWTGTPLTALIEETDPQGAYIMLRAADGYYYSMPMEMAEHGLLAYGMNGETLPRAHGFPVRALVPNRWGKLNVKWLEEIEVIDQSASGYWEERGWNGMEPVNTVVKIQATNRLSNGAVQLGGHAYAGTRGIETVEVSLDAGDTWSEATLADPLSGRDTWRQWKYEWEPGASSYNVVVRATDGTGSVQTRVQSGPYPDGATGWTKLQLDVQG